jgi:hypothetical protein
MTAQAAGHRFPILITQLSQLLMIPFGVTRRRAFAQLQEGELHIRFGPMFDERIPLEKIEVAESVRWPRWAGVGPRANFRGSIGLVGSYSNVVKLTLKEPMDAHLFVVPVTCRRLYLSLEHPDRFLKELGRMPAEQPEAAKAA